MKKIIFLITFGIFCLALNSCTKVTTQTNSIDVFENYLSNMKFIPFTTPNNGYLPTTIFMYSKGGEVAVAFPSDCDSIKKFDNGLFKVLDREVFTISQTIKSGTNLSLKLSPELVESLDLNAAFKKTRLKTIKIELIEPFSYAISLAKAQTLISGGTDFCKKETLKKGNIMIAEVFGAKGVKFSFLDSTNNLIKSDINFKKILTSVDSLQRNIQGTGTLISQKIMFYGYRAFEVNRSSGAIEDRVVISEIDLEDLKKMKNQSLN